MSKEYKLTKWEAGNELAYCADELSGKESDLRNGGYPELADLLKSCRLKIGTAFNDLDQHSFGLPDERNP